MLAFDSSDSAYSFFSYTLLIKSDTILSLISWKVAPETYIRVNRERLSFFISEKLVSLISINQHVIHVIVGSSFKIRQTLAIYQNWLE